MTAATVKLTASASNIANADDTSAVGSSGGYKPLGVNQTPIAGGGVSAQAVTLKAAQLIIYDPTSPVANGQGFVQAPEIDPITEVMGQIDAGRAFAFSLKALRAANQEEKTLLDLKT
jgi:flagellar basal-body rod protein FlgC